MPNGGPTVAAPTHRPLEPEQLRWFCDPAQLSFETTEELQRLDGNGFNVCVAGPRGTGRGSRVDAYVRRLAASQPAPEDWRYVQQQQGLALTMTPSGPMLVPLSNRRPMSQEELLQLSEQERERLNQRGEELARGLREIGEQVRQLERETHQRTPAEVDQRTPRLTPM